MKKIINQNENVVEQMLDGFLDAFSSFYEKVPGVNAILYKNRRKDKVSLIIGGGSGHEPLFSGFVGKGLADGVTCGNIFASPNPQIIYEAGLAADNGKGVLFMYGNYAGDNMNFDIGEELLNDEGIKTAHVRIMDDCISAPKERMEDRRGIAGGLLVYKVAGAACDKGLCLEDVVKVAEKARDNTFSAGIATSPASIPGLDNTTFTLGENEMEFGMGIHGEPGVQRMPMGTADSMTEMIYAKLKEEMNLSAGDELAVLVNGLGSTTLLEMYIVYNRLGKLLREDGIKVHDSDVNTYCTCQEMGGFSISFMRLDDELKEYYDAPCFTPYYAKGLK